MFLSVIQQSKSGVPFSHPRCLKGSRKSMRNIIVRAETSANDDGLSAFLGARARLLGIAHRILKSAAEAEDLVQDVWVRWQTTDRSTVRDATAFLVTMTRHLAINVIRCARSRRQRSFEDRNPQRENQAPRPYRSSIAHSRH